MNRDTISVLRGKDDETFEEPITSQIASTAAQKIIVTGDFNRDNVLDIAIAFTGTGYIRIVFGIGNGTFGKETAISVTDCYILTAIFVADLNNDNYSDIAITCNFNDFLGIFFGNTNETFSKIMTFDTGAYSSPSSIAITDFNNDNYLDIAVVNYNRNVGIFLGRGNGSFDAQKRSFTGGQTMPVYIAVGDFNEDGKQDIVVSYELRSAIGVMFGYGNGTFSERLKLMLDAGNSENPIIVSDFNNDYHLDIAAFTYSPYTLNIFYGDGKGNFEMYRIYSSEADNENYLIFSADFNNDSYQDIIFCSDNGINIFSNTAQCDNVSQILAI